MTIQEPSRSPTNSAAERADFLIQAHHNIKAAMARWREQQPKDLCLTDLSHEGLHHHLIPVWLKESDALSDRIEESAFGQTPDELHQLLLDALEIQSSDVLLDLGAGTGRLIHALAETCACAFGIERNPKLHDLGEELRRGTHSRSKGILGDFLETPWPEATKVYTASARYPERTRRNLATLIEHHTHLRMVGALGRPVPLQKPWTLQQSVHLQVRWNPGEEKLSETLYIYRKG